MTKAVGGAGLLGLAFLAAPALSAYVVEDGPPREHPAAPAPPAPPAQQDGEGDPPPADEKEAVDAMAKRVQELAERLTRQAEPVADEVRKAIGGAASSLGDTLKQDGVSTSDIKAALEQARDELTRAFQDGGTIDRSARDAIRKAQEEVRDNLEKSRQDARQALRRRYEAERERLGAIADEARDKVVEKADEAAKSADEVERRISEEFRSDPAVAELYSQRQEVERQRDQLKESARREDDPTRATHDAQWKELTAKIDGLWRDRYHELRRQARDADEPAEEGNGRDRAQRRIRELQQQLREAQRELQQAERPAREARPNPPRGRFGAMRPGPGPDGRRGFAGPGRPAPAEADRRLDALEAKMDRVLQALEGLKVEKPDGDDDDDDDDDDNEKTPEGEMEKDDE